MLDHLSKNKKAKEIHKPYQCFPYTISNIKGQTIEKKVNLHIMDTIWSFVDSTNNLNVQRRRKQTFNNKSYYCCLQLSLLVDIPGLA